jgi:hypothetical protein
MERQSIEGQHLHSGGADEDGNKVIYWNAERRGNEDVLVEGS